MPADLLWQLDAVQQSLAVRFDDGWIAAERATSDRARRGAIGGFCHSLVSRVLP